MDKAETLLLALRGFDADFLLIGNLSVGTFTEVITQLQSRVCDSAAQVLLLRGSLQNCLDVHDGVGGTPHGVWDAARTILANDPQTDGGCGEDWDDSADVCQECDGLGTDKWCDHLLPCPLCHGDCQI